MTNTHVGGLRCMVQGSRKVEIAYQAGKDKPHTDALSHQPHLLAPVEGVAQGDVQVSAIKSTPSEKNDIVDSLLQANPGQRTDRGSFAEEQRKTHIQVLVDHLDRGVLPKHTESAHTVVLQVPSFTNND